MSSSSSSAPPSEVRGSRRRGRAEAVRRVGVRVRLSPEEAAVVRVAASRAGLSVGAWVADAAVARARGDAEGNRCRPSSWRELVAALVTLRTEVVDVRGVGVATGDEPSGGQRVPVVQLGPSLDTTDPLDLRSVTAPSGSGEVVSLLRRIDAATATASTAASTAGRRSRAGRRGPRGSS